MTKANLSMLKKNWPSALVAREKVYEFTGGIISQSRLANLDCHGEGPKGRIRIGRKVAYPVDELIEWLESRSEVID